jgi:acetyl esterase
MDWLWQQYAPSISPDDPDISPLRRPTLPPLPPTFVATAEHDVLRDEGIAYVEKLRAAGTTVAHDHAASMHHNFFVNPATVARFPQCDEALSALGSWLKKTFTAT